MVKGIKKKEILNDPDVKRIAVEHIDKDESQIQVISEVKESHGKAVAKIVGFLGALGVLTVLIVSSIFLVINTNVVQGSIEGAMFEIAGFSVVDKDYSPEQYIKAGKTVYYGGDKDAFITFASGYGSGKVDKVSGNRVLIEGSLKSLNINFNEIDYVLKDE